jgi:hypothetical protein
MAVLWATLAMVLLMAGAVWAADGKPSDGQPITAKVGFQLTDIRNVNMLSGDYDAYFNLIFRTSAPCEPAGFQLENGRIQSAVPLVSEPTYKVYRIRAQLTFDVDTRKIPFDRQDLAIMLRASDPGIRYVMDPEATPTQLKLNIIDWVPSKQLTVTPIEAVTSDANLAPFRYQYQLTLHRSGLWSVLRFMLPAFALTGSAFLVLVLPDDFKSRLGSALAAFIGQVFLQLSVGGRVPVRDGLPFWDKYQLTSYVTIILVIMYLFYDNALKERELVDQRKRLTTFVRAFLPTAWIVVMGAIVITTFW